MHQDGLHVFPYLTAYAIISRSELYHTTQQTSGWLGRSSPEVDVSSQAGQQQNIPQKKR